MHCKDLTGIAPRKSKPTSESKDTEAKPADESAPVDSDVPAAQQQMFKTMFMEYYKSLEVHLVRDHKVRAKTCNSHGANSGSSKVAKIH